ncbi:unnamed protein product [Strongylus vulgaris]|uniref:Uncharacterized protein n=1 Tax=Strongylus vulgaris TaxID=40348 RepID=A0A3P7JFL5_STRVU|nr:unnamed protein product [Strongylus vulgaris]
MFSHLLCPILGDELYCSRLTEIDGKVAIVQPKDLHRIRAKRYFPPALIERLGVPFAELQSKLPLYCHIHSTVFPRFGWMIGRPKSEQDVADLYANAPPPRTFRYFPKLFANVFPRFGWMIGRPKSEQDVADLYANAPPPQHFLAMVEALGMNTDLERYFHEDEGEDQVVGGDEKF